MNNDWQVIDHAAIPGDDGTLFLVRRGDEFHIHVDGRQLMTNGHHGSEAALSDLACDRIDLADAHVLVGGLGMGFTLRAVLDRLGEDGRVTVAELVPSVVRWNREHVGEASGHPLADPRTTVYEGDVASLLGGEQRWSAVLLDVDNGPRLWTRPRNGWLYTKKGVRRAARALRPGGVLGVWSAHGDEGFTRRLRSGGFRVEVIAHHEEGRESRDGLSTDTIWMATRR